MSDLEQRQPSAAQMQVSAARLLSFLLEEDSLSAAQVAGRKMVIHAMLLADRQLVH
jgi:hypothetical protein